MALLLAFAFLSGVITILSPCILPVLPIVLSGSTGRGKARPFGVVAGFVVTFIHPCAHSDCSGSGAAGGHSAVCGSSASRFTWVCHAGSEVVRRL